MHGQRRDPLKEPQAAGISLSIPRSIHLTARASVCLSVYLSIDLRTCLSVYRAIE